MTYIYYNPEKNKVSLVEIVNGLTCEYKRYDSADDSGKEGPFGIVNMMNEGYELIGTSFDFDLPDEDDVPEFDYD